MGITSEISGDGREVRIAIDGRFDFEQHRAFRQAYATLDTGREYRFHIDLTRAEYMDSAALGMLLVLREWAGGERADITLLGGNSDLQKILNVARFNELFRLENA